MLGADVAQAAAAVHHACLQGQLGRALAGCGGGGTPGEPEGAGLAGGGGRNRGDMFGHQGRGDVLQRHVAQLHGEGEGEPGAVAGGVGGPDDLAFKVLHGLGCFWLFCRGAGAARWPCGAGRRHGPG